MSDFRNWDLPSPLGPPTLVAGFWDDLKDTSDGVLDIYYWTDPAGRFIVEWSRVDNRFPDLINRIETFEIIVYDPAVQSGPTGDCDILFQYFEVNDVDYDNNFSTVGIEDYWHHRGLEYIYAKDYESHPTAHTLHNQMAVKITTTPPDNYSGVENHPGVIPDRYSLAQNFPNPFNQETVIQFELAKSGMTILEIYDINGRKIKTLIFDELNAGKYSVRWNGTDSGGKPISSGIYFVQLQSGDYRQSIKIVLLK
jgi:hypothetical protein